MTEKEKAAAGYLYNANYDEEILADISRCNDLCHEFNQLKPSERTAQNEILKKIFGQMGNDVIVNTLFWCDYGYDFPNVICSNVCCWKHKYGADSFNQFNAFKKRTFSN